MMCVEFKKVEQRFCAVCFSFNGKGYEQSIGTNPLSRHGKFSTAYNLSKIRLQVCRLAVVV